MFLFGKTVLHHDARKAFIPDDLPHQNCYTAVLGLPAGLAAVLPNPGCLVPTFKQALLGKLELLPATEYTVETMTRLLKKDGLVTADLEELEQGHNLIGAWGCYGQESDGHNDFHFRTYYTDGTITEATPGTPERPYPAHEEHFVRHIKDPDPLYRAELNYHFAGFFRISDEGAEIALTR